MINYTQKVHLIAVVVTNYSALCATKRKSKEERTIINIGILV